MAYPATHFSLCMFQIPEKRPGRRRGLGGGGPGVSVARLGGELCFPFDEHMKHMVLKNRDYNVTSSHI